VTLLCLSPSPHTVPRSGVGYPSHIQTHQQTVCRSCGVGRPLEHQRADISLASRHSFLWLCGHCLRRAGVHRSCGGASVRRHRIVVLRRDRVDCRAVPASFCALEHALHTQAARTCRHGDMMWRVGQRAHATSRTSECSEGTCCARLPPDPS
jgi:hypothetical protein